MIRRVEPQAAEHVRGDLAALLRDGASSGCSAWKSGASQSNAFNCLATWAMRCSRGAGGRRRIDRLPHQRPAVGRIEQHQPVQEGRAAARQAGDKDRLMDRLRRDTGHRTKASCSISRFDRNRTTSQFVALRPTRLSADLAWHESSSRQSGPMNDVLPKSRNPVLSRAVRTSASASNGRSSRPK